MAIDVRELPTEDVVLAGPGRKLVAGDTFRAQVSWLEKQSGDPLDFTGYTMAFDVIDSTGTTIETGVVTPAVGDATGAFILDLTAAQTANALMLGRNTLRLRGVSGALVKTFVCSDFTVSACP